MEGRQPSTDTIIIYGLCVFKFPFFELNKLIFRTIFTTSGPAILPVFSFTIKKNKKK